MSLKLEKNDVVAISLLLLISAALAFYVYYNANWLIGDNLLFIRSTAIGEPFPISENFRPRDGRFCPLGQQHNNLLLLLQPNGVSVKLMYARNALQICVFPLLLFLFLLKIERDNFRPSKWHPWIAIGFTLMYVARVYGKHFLDITYGGGFSQFLLLLFLYASYMFFRTNRSSYAICSGITAGYLTYMGEPNFGMFLVFAATPLLFGYKTLTHSQKIYCWLIGIGNTLLFLSLYYFLVMRYTEFYYHPNDVENMSYTYIFFKMLRSQKIAIVAFLFLFVRLFFLLYKRETRHLYFDALLFAGCALFVGNVILKLPTGHYYQSAIFIMLPSVLYFTLYYCKELCTFLLAALLGGFYSLKVPREIQENQAHRLHDYPVAERLAEKVKDGCIVMAIVPEKETAHWDMVWAEYYYSVLQTMLQFSLQDQSYELSRVTPSDVSTIDTCAYIIGATSYGAPQGEIEAIDTFGSATIYSVTPISH